MPKSSSETASGPLERPLNRWKIWHRALRNVGAVRNLTAVLISTVFILFVGFEFDLFENDAGASKAELTLELDELLLAATIFVAGLLATTARLYWMQKQEMARRVSAEREVRKLAYQDPLTGLANRRLFEDNLKRAIESPPKTGACHAVLLLDLNGFKQINDTHGHDVGDEVLITVANRLLGVVREGDLVARLGGDEFIILAQHLLGAEDASSIALRIIQSLVEPIACRSVLHEVGTGIGIALLPDNADTESEAIRKADVALYRAKSERRSAYRFFDEEMDRLVREREHLESHLRNAVASNSIVPDFRPLRDLRTNSIVGFEVVPVWMPASEGIPAERFLPVAEETGMIHQLGRSLLETACLAAKEWPDDIQLSINIFPGQLKDRKLGATILGTIAEAGCDPSRVEISIAENLVVKDFEAAKRVFGELNEAGVKTAVDNFGTGYSNIYHMRDLKVGKVKIDQRLAQGMDQADGAKVLRALAGLGRGLGLMVSINGLADTQDKSFLIDSGVDEGQDSDRTVSAEESGRMFTTATELKRSI